MPSSSLPYKQAANVERRTWDKEAYEAKAKARIKEDSSSSSSKSQKAQSVTESAQIGQKRSLVETMINKDLEVDKEEFKHAEKDRAGPMNSKRAFLKARSSRIDLESKVGTSEIINPEGGASSGGAQISDGVSKASSGGVGWHCNVCDCFLKDSLAYLDHINGRKHQRALGYSMRAEKSTSDDVSNRLQLLVKARNKKEEEEKQKALEMMGGNDDEDKMNEFQKIVKEKDDEISKRKKERSKRREERRKKAQQEKMKKPEIDMAGDNEEEDEAEAEDDGGQLDMAKMMGFSSFGA